MKLPSCWNCKHEFRLRELFLPWKQKCPICNKKQFLTKESRFNTLLFSPVPVVIMNIMILLGVSWLPTILVSLCLLIIGLAVMPYFYHFTDKEAPYV